MFTRAGLFLALFLASAAGAAQPPPEAGSDTAAASACDPAAAECDASASTAAESAAIPERAIDEPFGNAWLGAADADVTLVVFADYSCPACREAQKVIDQLLASDPHLRVVYRLLINEESGRKAAWTSLAVAQSKDDWSRFHRAMEAAGAPTSATIAAALKTASIAPASLGPITEDALLDSPVEAEIAHNDSLIYQRQGKAIPAWVLGDGPALNNLELAPLQAAIASFRARRQPVKR
jgi:protein-disulfide isomerase